MGTIELSSCLKSLVNKALSMAGCTYKWSFWEPPGGPGQHQSSLSARALQVWRPAPRHKPWLWCCQNSSSSLACCPSAAVSLSLQQPLCSRSAGSPHGLEHKIPGSCQALQQSAINPDLPGPQLACCGHSVRDWTWLPRIVLQTSSVS